MPRTAKGRARNQPHGGSHNGDVKQGLAVGDASSHLDDGSEGPKGRQGRGNKVGKRSRNPVVAGREVVAHLVTEQDQNQAGGVENPARQAVFQSAHRRGGDQGQNEESRRQPPAFPSRSFQAREETPEGTAGSLMMHSPWDERGVEPVTGSPEPIAGVNRCLTLVSMRSRISRNFSGGTDFGSGMSQSSFCLAATAGQESPQPMVTTAANSIRGISSRDWERWPVRSYPNSAMDWIAAGWTLPEGRDPAL